MIVTNTPGGHLCFYNILETILVIAMVIKEAELAHFHAVMFPQMADIAKFHPKTAQGKLKAVITPIGPKGFHYSII